MADLNRVYYCLTIYHKYGSMKANLGSSYYFYFKSFSVVLPLFL
jgi:hypothetical protein